MDGVIDLQQFKQNKIETEKQKEIQNEEASFKEFCKLLKYFLAISECQHETINIVKDNDWYIMTDKSGKKIQDVIGEVFEITNILDSIMNNLITFAPKYINIDLDQFDFTEDDTNTFNLIFKERINVK